jgi:hypothetical protein
MNTRGLAAVFICLLSCAAFANSFAGTFVFDDIHEIESNPALERLWPPWQAMFVGNRLPARPLPYLSFAIDRRLWGTAPGGFHLTNLLIHVTAALALFELARLTLLSPRLKGRWGDRAVAVAAVIASIWAVHPLQTQSVTYIYQRIESLHGLFFLAALAAFARAATAGWSRRWLAACLAATAAAMASKETAVVLPLLILAWDWCFAAAGSGGSLWSRRRWYALLASTWAILAIQLATQGSKYLEFRTAVRSPLEYALTQPGVILHYLLLAFWPASQRLDYSGLPVARLPAALPAVVAVLALAGIAIVGLVRCRTWAWLGIAFFLALAPTSSILPIEALANEQRMYLPLAALAAGCVILATAAAQWLAPRLHQSDTGRSRALAAVAAAVLLALTATTWARNRVYTSIDRVWQDVLSKDPRNYRAHWALAITSDEAGGRDAAVDHAVRAVELKPSARALLDLAARRRTLGDAAGAEALCRTSLEMQQAALAPDDPAVLASAGDLAVVIYLQGRLDEAAAICRDFYPAMERVRGADDATTVASLVIMADADARQGDGVAAERLAREAVARVARSGRAADPMAANAAGVLAGILERNGKLDEAVVVRRRLAEDAERAFGPQHPRSQEAATRLAQAMAAQCSARGDHAGAVRLYRILVEGFARSLGADHPETLAVRQQLEAAERMLQPR